MDAEVGGDFTRQHLGPDPCCEVGGIAVHVGARVAAEAAPGEVLVSGTVKDLVAGSGIPFRERGATELKGIPGEWRLYSVEQPVAVG